LRIELSALVAAIIAGLLAACSAGRGDDGTSADDAGTADARLNVLGVDAAPDIPTGADGVATNPDGSDGSTADDDAGPTDAPAVMPMPTTLALLAGGLGGPGYADGTGVAVRFYDGRGVASDGAGNLFIADTGNHIIRKLVLATGEVTTFAGSPGVSGSADGTGANARFFQPSGIAADGAGNLFVADTSNETVRKIVIATGAVTTLAGTAGMFGGADGTGADARFQEPTGIAADGAGSLFVADSSNHTIRRIAADTRAVTTLAGTAMMAGSADGTGSKARFLHPLGVAADGAGNLFVADTENHRIRTIVIATGVVTTLAGSAMEIDPGSADGTGRAAKFDRPSGLVSDGAGDLFVADTDNQIIRKIVVATAAVTTLAGKASVFDATDGVGAAARFTYPQGLTSDGAGNLFVVGSAVRKIVIASATVTTVAGAEQLIGATDGVGGAARFFTPKGVVTDGAGSAFVADSSNNSIRRVALATGAVTTLAGSTSMGSANGTGPAAGFNGPSGITTDGAGNLFVADTFNSTIRKVVVATGAVTTLAGAPGAYDSADGTGSAARFNLPGSLTSDGAGNLFVADTFNQTIRQIVIATAAVTTLAGSPELVGTADGTGDAARFNRPSDIAADGAGNLFVADTLNHAIRRIDIATGAVTTLAGMAGMPGSADGPGRFASFASPGAVAVDRFGDLFVADTENHLVRKIVVATGAVTTLMGSLGHTAVVLGPLPAVLNRPQFLTVDRSGALLITDENAVLVAR